MELGSSISQEAVVWRSFLPLQVRTPHIFSVRFLPITYRCTPHVTKKQIYLMAIPVGLIAVSMLLMGVTVSVENQTQSGVVKHYGHTESIPEYFLFLGTVMFVGTLVPEMFNVYRERFKHP